MKKLNQSGSLDAVLVVVLVLVVAVGGVVYWRINSTTKDEEKTTANNSQDNQKNSANDAAEYKKKTTVPADWETYENKEYGFKVSFPKGWNDNFSVIDKSQDEQNVYSKNADKVAVFGVSPGSLNGSAFAQINIQEQTLEDTATQLKKYFTDNKIEVTGETKLKYDGKDMLEIKTKQSEGAPTVLTYLIYSGKNTYVMNDFQEVDFSMEINANDEIGPEDIEASANILIRILESIDFS